jgi:hypothetical protein
VDGRDVRPLERIVRRHGLETTEPFIGEGRPLFSAVCSLDLEDIVAKGMADGYMGELVRPTIDRAVPAATGDARVRTYSNEYRLHNRLFHSVCNSRRWLRHALRLEGQ